MVSKHNLKLFNKAVKQYKKKLKIQGDALIVLPFKGRQAFFSLAPLSKALHDLGKDVCVLVYSNRSESNLPILERVWQTHERMKQGGISKEEKLLQEFIAAVEKKTKKHEFERIFKKPEIIIKARENGFVVNDKILLQYDDSWFRKFDESKLKETCRKIAKDCYALKKNERFSISFELVPSREMLELPLEDYLDNFAIAYFLAKEAKRFCREVSLSASTAKPSKLSIPERVSELASTLAGCEYEKGIKEKPFQLFAKLSKLLKISEWKYSKAGFAIVGKGYHGKHIFGLAIGYPSPDRKTRWSSPGSMFLKPWWFEQTKLDKRKPMKRFAITETLPLEEFIQTCNINYSVLRKRDAKIKRIIEKSKLLVVEGRDVANYKTELIVELGRGSKKRLIQRSDSDVRKMIDKEVLRKYNLQAGVYDNIPGGEVFFTPESINGFAVGDVVINIDRSYTLSAKNPIVVKFTDGKWKLIKAPQVIRERIAKELRDVKKLIKTYEQKKSLPKKIIENYKRNLFAVGEFAINTNPAAKLSRYLIVNEKLANMMHIALGSGFEPDRQTLYHWDFVINVPRQKISIAAIDSEGNIHYIIKDGKFVV